MEKKMKLLAALAALSLAFACVSCSQDGDTIISGAQTHAVVFNIGGGAEISVQTVENGKLVTEPAVAEKDGYVFSGWYTDAALTTRFSFETPITENLTLYARYAVKVLVDENGDSDGDGEIDPATVPTEEGEAVYAVKHYKQELDGNTYALAKTEQKVGKIGELSAAQVQDFEGFIPAYFSQVTVTENSDGTMAEVVITYNRRVYTVTFVSEETTVAKQVILYGDTGLAPTAPERTGYEFAGWSADGETAYDFASPVTASMTLTVLWIPLDVNYKVSHHFQNIVDDEYTYTRQVFMGDDSILQQLTGKSGSQTEAAALTSETMGYIPTTEQQRRYLLPEGFTVQKIEQKEIAGDGSTVIDVYYDRKTVTYTFAPDGGAWKDGTTETKSASGKYGAPLTIEKPTRSGYLFVGWGLSSSCFGTEDAALTAQWIAEGSGLPAQDAVAYINEMTESGTVVVAGDVTAEQISALRDAIRNRYEVAGIQVALNLAGTTMTELAEDAFRNCYGLSEIILPDTLTTIGNSAFIMCDSLTAVTIPEGVTFIGMRAFALNALTSVVFADGENWYKADKASYTEWNDSDKINVSDSVANATNLTASRVWREYYLVKKVE